MSHRWRESIRWPRPLAALALLAIAASPVGAQTPFDPTDPLTTGRLVIDSPEVVITIGASSGSTRQVTLDADVPVGEGGPVVSSEIVTPIASAGRNGNIDVAVGDFGRDGRRAWLTVWDAGPNVVWSTPGVDPDLPGATFASRLVVHANLSATPSLDFANHAYPIDLKPLRIEGGDVDGDGSDDVVFVFRQAPGTLSTNLYGGEGGIDPTSAGLLASERHDTLSFSCPAPPSLPPGAAAVDFALGDLDGDGDDEIVLVYVSTICNRSLTWTQVLRVRILDYTGGDGLDVLADEALSSRSFSSNGSNGLVHSRAAVAAGDLDADGIEEIAFSWVETHLSQFPLPVVGRIGLARYDAITGTLVPGAAIESHRIASGVDGHPFAVEIDDLDAGGRAEILHLANDTLRVYSLDEPSLSPALRATRSFVASGASDASHRPLVVADVDIERSDVFAKEILVLGELQTGRDPLLYAYHFEEDEEGRGSLGLIGGGRLDLGRDAVRVSLRAVNLDDDGARLGEPKVFRRSNVLQPIVTLNSPPFHFDTFGRDPLSPCYREVAPGTYVSDSSCIDVNMCFDPSEACDTSARFSRFSEVTLETTVTSTWATESTLGVTGTVAGRIGFLSASVSASLDQTFGRDFEKSTGTGRSIEVRSQTQTSQEDRYYATRTTYDVFEYPVLDHLGDPMGFVTAVVPDDVIPTWIRSNSADAALFQLLPEHEPGNLLSYRPIEGGAASDLADVDSAAERLFIEADARDVPPNGADQWSVSFREFTSAATSFGSSQTIQRQLNVGIEAAFESPAAALSVGVEGRYSDVSTHTTKFETSSTLAENHRFDVDFGRIDNTLMPFGMNLGAPDYFVRPFVYWNHDGALVLDYGVELVESRGGFWDSLYGQAPDLTFLQPKRHDRAKGFATPDAELHRTRDIVINPRNPEAGEPIEIAARVQNLSLVDSPPSRVRFYLGDPFAGGTEIAEVDVPSIPARGREVVTHQGFVVPRGTAAGTPIFAWVDPTDELAEVHEDNNLAWAATGISTVPEPDALVANTLALAVLALLRRRRRT